jgi:hypothetical protein
MPYMNPMMSPLGPLGGNTGFSQGNSIPMRAGISALPGVGALRETFNPQAGNTGITSSIAQSAGGPAVTDQRVLRALQNNPNATPEQITSAMGQYGIGQGQYDRVAQSMNPAAPTPMNPSVGGVPMPGGQTPANGQMMAQEWYSANPNTSIGINAQGQYQGPEGLRAYHEQGAAGINGGSQGLQAQPQYGLQGAEQAALIGAGLGLQNLGDTQSQVENIFGRGAQNLQPFQQQGGQAYALQAALSGAMGPEAQAQAYQQFQRSPGQQFLQQEGERALTRNAAAIGGLGGGNVRRSLLEYGQGLAQQDFANQFDRLGQLSSAGLNAASTGAQLQGQQAGIQANLGQLGAQIPVQTGAAIAQNRFQTGRDIGTARANTSTALANLMSQQGAGISDIIGGSAAQINQLYQMAAQGDVAAKEQLGVVLANLSAQQGSQYGQQQFTPIQPPSMLGDVGKLASGLGGMMQYTPNKWDYTTEDTTEEMQTSFPTMRGRMGAPIDPLYMQGNSFNMGNVA